MLKLFKTDASLGKSILQSGPFDKSKPLDPEGPDNIIQLADELDLKQVVYVEDDLGGFISNYKELAKHGRAMVFGWRVSFVQDAADLTEQCSHKNIIFVKNEAGWKKLIKLATKSQTTYFFKGARLDYKTFFEYYDENSMVLGVPFYDSFIFKNLTTKTANIPDFRHLKPWFFKESNDHPLDSLVAKGVDDYVAANGGRIIDAKTIYYKNRADCYIFLARKLMERKVYGSNDLSAPNQEFFCSDEFCLESALESKIGESEAEKDFLGLFKPALSLFLPGIRLPEYVMSREDRERYEVPENASNDDILRILARVGFKKKLQSGEIPRDQKQIYVDRVKHELKIFESTCFTDYILIVYSLMDFVNTRNLARGIARGSAGGSLVMFLLDIIRINPIPNGLYFERFVNPERADKSVIKVINEKTGKEEDVVFLKSCADVDIDLGSSAKEQAIEWLKVQYPGRFCKLATYGTYATKVAVKDCMKVIGLYSEEESKAISDEVSSLFGKVASPEKAYEESEKFRNFMDNNPDIFRAVKKLHDGKKNIGSHASAYLITHDPLDETFDLRFGTDNEIISSVDMHTSESIAVKLDLLGLLTVSLLDNASKSAGVDILKIDYDSPEIHKHLVKLDHPAWLFQISGDAAVRSLNRVGILGNLFTLSCIISICRPGSFAFLDQYADFLNGRCEMPVLHPLFNDILSKTSGICLFQESLLEMLVKIGCSLSMADSIRRIVGKKKKDEMLLWEDKIYQIAKENNVDEAAAKAVWDIALASADYSFNRCLDPKSIVTLESGESISMKNVIIGDRIKSYDIDKGVDIFVSVLGIYENKKELLKITTEGEFSLTCSVNHKILCEDLKMRPLWEILHKKHLIYSKSGFNSIVKVEFIGQKDTLDFEVDHKDHVFYANDIVVSNSHGASYAMTTVASVYLKFFYPLDFFTEAFKLCKEKQDPTGEIAVLVRELPAFGIELLPPDLIKSEFEFKKEGNNIRYGLGSIKSIAEKSITKIKQFIDKDKADLFSLFEAAKQAKLNSTLFVALVESGCFDDFRRERQRVSLDWRIYKELTVKESQYCLKNGKKYGFDLKLALGDFLNWADLSGKIIGKQSRLDTINRKIEPFNIIYEENSKNRNVSEYMHEKALLGFSQYTLRGLFEQFPYLHSAEHVKTSLYEKDRVRIVAEILEVKIGTSKKSSRKYLKLEIGDEVGTITAGMFGDAWEKYSASNSIPEEGQIVYITGSKGPDIIWIESMQIQVLNIFMRVRDLKRLEKKEDKLIETSNI